MQSRKQTFPIPESLAGQTLAGAIRRLCGTNPPPSWTAARKLIADRRVLVGGRLCLDDTRRLDGGETVTILASAHAAPPGKNDVRIVYADEDLVVVDKPAGMQTLRRIEESNWSDDRKRRQPTLDEIVPSLLGRSSRVHAVHRLDRDTSGLMIFALSEQARIALVRMFKKHEVHRVYIAVVHGRIDRGRKIETMLVSDRGDGLRGSGSGPDARPAVTHVKPVESIGGNFTIVQCRLETGRTHQIRIHLSEIGHMLAGENTYTKPTPDSAVRADHSGARRQALHSAELQFIHPITARPMHFSSPLPRDLSGWIKGLGDRQKRNSPNR